VENPEKPKIQKNPKFRKIQNSEKSENSGK